LNSLRPPENERKKVIRINGGRKLQAPDRYDLTFNEGSHFQLYDKLGAHVVNHEGVGGTQFAVWAPNAAQVFVMGDFNGWNKNSDPLHPNGQSGIWEGFFPGIGNGTLYKYHIVSRFNDYRVDKTDPFSIFNEIPPKTASIVWNLDYQCVDDEGWMTSRRRQRNALDKPMAIYEMHAGSWRRWPNRVIARCPIASWHRNWRTT
jgi:1,4-alpha-glucan branching enzyme